MTDADVQRITRWSDGYKPIAADMLVVSEALAQERLDDARVALDRLPPRLDSADALVRSLETADLRATMDDYMAITRKTIVAFDRLLDHLTSEPRDTSERVKRLEALRSANEELFKADSKIADRIFDHASEEQQKTLERVIPKAAFA